METDRNSAIPFALLCYGGDGETRLAMTFKSRISRFAALFIAFVLTVAPSGSPAHSVEDDLKVVVISACYSGVFIPRLANPDMLVITAADADHPSFGCRDKAKWTYFGDAFFNVALRQASSLKEAFVVARALVQKRELREHSEPSSPQMAGGANVQPLLIAGPYRPPSPEQVACDIRTERVRGRRGSHRLRGKSC